MITLALSPLINLLGTIGGIIILIVGLAGCIAFVYSYIKGATDDKNGNDILGF